VISPSDPQSAWTAKANKRVPFRYGLNYLIDIQNVVIVDVEATLRLAPTMKLLLPKRCLDRTEGRFNLKPKRLAADTAYGTGKFLGWLVKKKKITPHIPVWEKSDRQDGIFSRSDFRWDRKRGAYICPKGKLLRTGSWPNGSNYFPPLRCLEATNVAKESLTGQPQKVKTKFRILEIELLEIPVADRK
jgi:hypothetical protein